MCYSVFERTDALVKLLQMKCPNCNANLQVDDGIESFFCQYCGTKIILEGQSNAAIRAKARLKTLDKVGEIQKNHHRQRMELREQKAVIQAAEERRALLVGGICFLVCILICVLMMVCIRISNTKENTRLETIYSEIQADMENGDYDSALMKANTLRFSADNKDLKNQWDQTRESLIEIIESKTGGK